MERISGNKCIYCMFMANAVLVFVAGLIDLFSGIAGCVEIGDFSWYNGGFMLLGILICVLIVFSYKSRTSLKIVTGYIVCLSLVFVV